MGRPVKPKAIPGNYKEADISRIINLLGTKTGTEVAKLYEVPLETFKKHLSILRTMGYSIPRVSYKETKSKVQKRLPKPEPKKLPNRVIDEKNLKWVKIDKRTMIQVPLDMDEQEAIDKYYERLERLKGFRT